METAIKAPQGVRPADKVLQALASLAALIDSTIREVKSLDDEFQTRLLQAVHDTEASLQTQTTEHVERARQEVQEQLNSKFQSEKSDLIAQVEKVKADSAAEIEKAREELKHAVHKTEVLLQAETNESIERARQEVQDQLNSKYRKDLQAALDGLKSEFETERERLNKELLHTVEAASKLEAERSGLIAEVQKVKAESAAEIEKAREEARAAAAKQPASAAPSAPPASLKQEIERAEGKLQDILKLIDNPATELSKVIRLNVEKSELEAYLKGIHLVLDSKS
jgi:colicin import membrane protein